MPSERRRKLEFIPSTKLKLGMDPPYLIKGIIPARGMTLAYGAKKAGKSFWVMDIAWHIATGTLYHDLAVTQGPVIYIPFEGHDGVRKRLMTINREKAPADELYVVPWHPKLEPAMANVTITELNKAGIKPALIILDTLNRSIKGEETADIEPYLDEVQTMIERLSCAVLLVHHKGHKEDRPRGPSQLSANADCQITIRGEGKGEDKTVYSKVEFMKDGPEGEEMGNYIRRKIWLYVTDGGEEIEVDTCILEAMPREMLRRKEAKTGRQSPIRDTALRLARRRASMNGGTVSVDEWKEECLRVEGGIMGARATMESRLRKFREAKRWFFEEVRIFKYADEEKTTFRIEEGEDEKA